MLIGVKNKKQIQLLLLLPEIMLEWSNTKNVQSGFKDGALLSNGLNIPARDVKLVEKGKEGEKMPMGMLSHHPQTHTMKSKLSMNMNSLVILSCWNEIMLDFFFFWYDWCIICHEN